MTQKEIAEAAKAQREEAKRNKENVEDLEMKARYWKAQYEIRYFTLEAEKIQEPYNVYLEQMKQKNAELQAKFEAEMEKLKEKGAEVKEN